MYSLVIKVRVAHCRTNKAQTLYGTDSFVCSVVVNSAGTGILSGHADGSIVRWFVADDQNARMQVRTDDVKTVLERKSINQ